MLFLNIVSIGSKSNELKLFSITFTDFFSVCPSGDIKQNGRNIYFLSNEQVDANTAESACNLLDGNLVSFADSQVERKVMNYIQAKYLAGNNVT